MPNAITSCIPFLNVHFSDVQSKAIVCNGDSPAVGGGLRGDIREFSRQSRSRLLFQTRNIPDLKCLITFTYPHGDYAETSTGGNFMVDGRVVKDHLRKLRQMLVYRGLAGIWFLEFQKRGAPHFHFFCQGSLDCSHVEKLKSSWHRMVGSSCLHHRARGVDYQVLRKKHSAAAYAAKYSAKSEQKTVPERYESCGRFWSSFGDLGLDRVDLSITDRKTFYDLIRTARRAQAAHLRSLGIKSKKRGLGLTGQVFYDSAPAIRVALSHLYTNLESHSQIYLRLQPLHRIEYEFPSSGDI